MTKCMGCGADLPDQDGPVHAYMAASPACFDAFTRLLAAEYSSAALMDVHRLTVDTWAVQHPGDPTDRRAVQSVGLHLARLFVQLESPRAPAQTNAVMLDFASHKSTLPVLPAPSRFSVTVDQIAPFAGSDQHAQYVREWAAATWQDWSDQHDFIKGWIAKHSDLDLV